MDTITHGFAGALIAKAAFGGDDLFAVTAISKRRIITWSVLLGAIFPDADVLRGWFSSDDLLIMTWHRSITHSLVCLPIWALLLAAVTLGVVRWRKWPAPSYWVLAGLWAAGLLSHIFLDLVTTFGTMIWSPFNWSRPAWDILFIVDFTFAALLLIPQLLAWAFEDPDQSRRRAMLLWLIFIPTPFIIARVGRAVGTPISDAAVLSTTLLFTLLFLLPAVRGTGVRVSYLRWNRAGLALACLYLLAATYAHHLALLRVEQFARRENLEVQTIGALPLPPSLWHWDGLVRGPRGVYEFKMDLGEGFWAKGLFHSSYADPDILQHTYYPDALPNYFIETARALPAVQKLFWFARFPLTRFHKEGTEAIVEFSDLRFPQIRRDRPASFTYRVRLSGDGIVQSQGWAGR